MGNRAMVVFEGDTHGIYLHWNGGPESVIAFIETMFKREWTRNDYASARFAGVAVEFFEAYGDDRGLSIGIEQYTDPESSSHGDNGVFLVKFIYGGEKPSWEMRQVKNKQSFMWSRETYRDKLRLDALGYCDAIVTELTELRMIRRCRPKGD